MRTRYRLERDVSAPSTARDVVEDVVAELGSRAADARIIASELVANSVRHSDAPAARPIELEVEFDADFVKIEVCDAGSGYERDAVKRRSAGHDGGFGLLLVAELSDAWGVSGNGGTCAWALLDRTKAPPSTAREAARLSAAPR
jgi:anti-sigma regulatory factor (Ser/Thr protein kinase)